jgi:hypothetical protein
MRRDPRTASDRLRRPLTPASAPPARLSLAQLNMRGDLPADYRARHHPKAPARTQWVAGVLLPSGVALTNGTWSPRWSW